MSTKTSLKKIAVIAAMALTLGGFTAVTANAAGDITSSAGANIVSGNGSLADPYVAVASTSATINIALASGFDAPVTVSPALPGAMAIATSGNTGTVSGSVGTTATSVTKYTLTNSDSSSKTGSFYFQVVAATTADISSTPWRALGADNAGTYDGSTGAVTAAVTVLDAATNVEITANNDTDNSSYNATTKVGEYRYVRITSGNATFAEASGLYAEGSLDSGSVAGSNYIPGNSIQLDVPLNGDLTPASFKVRTVTAGTVTVQFRKYVGTSNPVTGVVTVADSLLQTISITVTVPTALNPVVSTAVLCATPHSATDGTYPKAGCDFSGTTDDEVLAKAALVGTGSTTSAMDTQKASIRVQLKDVSGNLIVGTRPAIAATITGPGTLSISSNAGNQASAGRYLTAAAAPSSDFYINIFSDGTSGVATIKILVGGTEWKSKTVTFYGAAKTLVASQNHKVLKAGTTTGAGCNPTSCPGGSVTLSNVAQVVATDANGVVVPGMTYTAVPDATVVTASTATSTGNADADAIGATWFSVTTAPDVASGKTGTVSYKATASDGTALVSNALTFAIGGAPVSVTIAASGSSEVGAKNSLVFTDKDAAGNAPYDLDVSLALTSNVALVVGSSTPGATSGLPSTIAMIGGTGSVNFFNPFVAGDVTISGKAAGLIPLSVTVSVSNSAVNAAADAAAEATDAANAATDAANAAAEAADAATAAAQDAADAVAALSAQVTAMISALKKQLIALTNLVIKIQKKVRA